MNDKNINWEEVENKISLICYKFSNLSSWHEDLAQELRIHAYLVSDDYYDLYRKAIDFWRHIHARKFPEIPYMDLETLGGASTNEEEVSQFEDIVKLIRKELTETTPQNKWESNKMELAMKLLNIMLEDIDPEKKTEKVEMSNNSSLNHYINHRLNLSWVAEETGIGYKQIVMAMKLLEDIVRGLHAMHKIEIPIKYFQGYYDQEN